MGKINFALLNCSAANYSPVNVSGAGFAAGGGKKSYTVAELCAMGYGVATDYGYNMKGDFAAAGVPIPTDLAARLAGEDGVLLKVTGLKADEAFWEAVRQALAEVTVPSEALPGYFQNTDMSGDVLMNVNAAGQVFSAEDMLNGSQITSLTLSGTGGYFSSGHWAFRRCGVVSVTTDTPVLCQDCSGMYEWCGKLESPAPVRWGDRLEGPAYPEGASNVEHMFDSCAALSVVPQYGDDREADANTLRPSRAYGFIGLSSVETLGPVLDLRYIDPADAGVCTLIFPSGDSLTDARLKNLNHGDWWLDGTAPEDGVNHGNLAGLDAASVEYLMAHLWDLSTDKTGKNWRTVENSFWMWEGTQQKTDSAFTYNFLRGKPGTPADSPVRTVSPLSNLTVRITGLAEGDRMEIGSGVVAPSDASVYTDGEYTFNLPAYGMKGFKVYNDAAEPPTSAITVEIVNEPYDAGNHLVDAAALHVPESWREKLTTDMLASAVARGWSVWIGEENLTAGLPSIFDSLVLWYDIAKQGATNEKMAENPVLKDLSGHGHDATCYNFGWAEESGISTASYPGALVSDGVDDYAYVDGLPLLTREKGYTVVAKRQWLETDYNNYSKSLLNKRAGDDTSGAFQIERSWNGKIRSFSFGSFTDIELSDDSIIYQTSKLYNGNSLAIGEATDTDKMYIASIGSSMSSAIALYTILLFNRDLTDEEIEWVKNNLIENNTEV